MVCAYLITDEGVGTVNRKETIEFMNNYGFSHYIETSAKTGDNVEHLFESITKHLYIVYQSLAVEVTF